MGVEAVGTGLPTPILQGKKCPLPSMSGSPLNMYSLCKLGDQSYISLLE